MPKQRGDGVEHIVVKPVVHPAAVPANPDEACVAQGCHMMRQRWLRYLEIFEKAASASLLAVPQQLEYAQAIDVPEGLEVGCEPLSVKLACDDARPEANDLLPDHAHRLQEGLIALAGWVVQAPVFSVRGGQVWALHPAPHGDEDVDGRQLCERSWFEPACVDAVFTLQESRGIVVDALDGMRSARARDEGIACNCPCHRLGHLASARIVRADKSNGWLLHGQALSAVDTSRTSAIALYRYSSI